MNLRFGKIREPDGVTGEIPYLAPYSPEEPAFANGHQNSIIKRYEIESGKEV